MCYVEDKTPADNYTHLAEVEESSSELDPRLEQLRRLEDWLGRLPGWQQHLLAITLALITGALAVWLNSLLPPIDANSIGPFVP